MKKRLQPLLQALERAGRELDLFKTRRPLLAAVSGGADSLALLLGLRALSPPGKPLLAVHVHHGIRGREADADAAFVRARCEALGIPLLEGRVDAPAVARSEKISLEMAARQARYGFFRDAAARTGAEAVATAHTADDQAETVLLKLLRGAGPRGLSGIAPRATVLGVPVVRPFLAVTRRAIESGLRAAGEGWREDRTNRDTRLLRNRVRHELLPVLEARFNPRIRDILNRTAAVLRDEEAWLKPLVKRARARTRTGDSLDGPALVKRPAALRRRIVRAWLMDAGFPEELLDYDLMRRLEALIPKREGTHAVEAGAGFRVVSEYGVWRIHSPAAHLSEGGPEREIRAPGVTDLPDWGIRVRVTVDRGFRKTPPPGLGRIPCRAWLDARAGRAGGVRIRRRLPGDRMELPGGSRKVQDLFTDAKVPRAARSAVPLFLCGGAIAWIPGGPVSSSWRVSSPRGRSWRVEVTPLSGGEASIAFSRPGGVQYAFQKESRLFA